MAAHIREAAHPVSGADLTEGIERLRRMATFNVSQLAGDRAGQEIEQRLGALERHPPTLAYGDGHMAPHKWVKSETETLKKTDWWGHDCDHTLVGVQSVLWDVAGAIVEWGLAGKGAVQLARASAPGVDLECVTAFVCAYAAFRAGLLSMLLAQAEGTERERLVKELDRVRNFLGIR